MHSIRFKFTLYLCFLYIPFVTAQEKTISKDSLQLLIGKTFDYAYDYDYAKAIATSGVVIDEALKQNDYLLASEGNLRLGSIYLRMKDTLNSLTYYKKSLTYAKIANIDSIVANVYNDIGNLYMETGGNLYAAKENFEKSLSIYKQSNASDFSRLAPYMNIAWVYIKLKEPLKALPNLNLSRKIIAKEKNIHPLYSINLAILRGQYYLQTQEYDNAVVILKDASDRAVQGNFLQQVAESHHFLSEVYEKKEENVLAIKCLKKEREYNEQFNKIIRSQQLQEASAKLKLEQYQKELDKTKIEQELSDKLASKSRELSVVFIITSIVLFFAALGAFLLYRSRKKYLKRVNAKNQELFKAKENAERLSKLKTQFFSTVSHELRTPLYGVIGLSSILLEDENLATHKDDLKSLKFSADYLLALINDVLTLNKADANGMQLEKIPFNLPKLITSITDSFAFNLQQNNNKIQVRIDEHLPKNLIGDSVKLSQILMNLVGNAVKFNENGTIEIYIKHLGKTEEGLHKIHFFVKDNGIGIAKEKQQSIFEEFSQVENNNYNYQGTGLGLPIVNKLLTIYGSKIELESELGSGSIFSFVLDLEENTAVIGSNIVEEEVLHTSISNNAFENMHILIVDDNKINQKVTQRILEKRHFKTSLADDGLQAIEKVQQQKFNLILMDVHMPKMGGIDATKHIRQYNKNLPIIALTAVEIEEARAEIIAAGMNDIILKPYDVAQFLTVILRNLKTQS